MKEVVVPTTAKRRANHQSNNHHQQTNTEFFTGKMTFLLPNQQCQSTERHTKQNSTALGYIITYYLPVLSAQFSTATEC